MSRLHIHPENHLVARAGSGLQDGASDSIVSTTSLIIGRGSCGETSDVLIAGVAGFVAGRRRYMSVSSQADTERAEISRKTGELSIAMRRSMRTSQISMCSAA